MCLNQTFNMKMPSRKECYTISLVDKNKYLTNKVGSEQDKIWKQPLNYRSIC